MKIGVLDALTVGKDIDLTPLSACGELAIYELTAPEEVAERVKDLDIIITNKVILGEENLKECTHLKMIEFDYPNLQMKVGNAVQCYYHLNMIFHLLKTWFCPCLQPKQTYHQQFLFLNRYLYIQVL